MHWFVLFLHLDSFELISDVVDAVVPYEFSLESATTAIKERYAKRNIKLNNLMILNWKMMTSGEYNKFKGTTVRAELPLPIPDDGK